MTELTPDELRAGCRLGVDSHADMSVAGRHALVLEYIEGHTCTVHPYHDGYDPKTGIQICNAAFAYDDPNGETYILRLNQCLDFTDSISNSLLCTNQVRANGVIVSDAPKAIDVTETSKQSIIFPESNHHLPLYYRGPIPFIRVRKPTLQELDEYKHLELTSPEPWDPELIIPQEIDSLQIDDITGNPHIETNEYINGIISRAIKSMHIDGVDIKMSKDIDPSILSKLWGINLDQARRTLRSTEHYHISTPEGQLSRRRRAGHGRREQRSLHGHLSRFCSDTFKCNVKSLRGNKYVQLFCNRGNFTKCYPMANRYEAPDTLHRFIDEVGVPSELLTDGAPELLYAGWKKLCQRYRIKQISTEPNSPWQNPAELSGGIIKRIVRRTMKNVNAPIRLWDYCWEYSSSVRNMTSTDHYLLDDVTPFQKIYEYSPDISEYVQYKWFDWIWFLDIHNPMRESLGRWLGPAQDCGEGFTSHILTKNGKVIVRSTTRQLTSDEIESAEVQQTKLEFTKEMESRIGNESTSTISNKEQVVEDAYENLFEEDDLDDPEIIPQEKGITFQDTDDPPFVEDLDEHIGVKLMLPVSGELKEGTILRRKRKADGTLVGTSHYNPEHDTREYEIEFEDGSSASYTTNIIMENLWSQTDSDGRFGKLFKGISSHRKNDNAISKENAWITMENNVKKRLITTKGWELLVDWDNGTQSWLPLHAVKQSNPIEVAEYAVSREIQEEPAFIWWVSHVLKKRNHFISKLKTTVKNKQLKYGLKVPKSVKEALQIDKDNNNSFWSEAINKELRNVIVAFQLLEEGEPLPIGSTRIPYHFVFDIKFDLTRKARLVAGGHRHRDVPTHDCYSSVASRDTVRLAFLIATMNNLKMLAADIGNAYLNAPCREKVHVTVGPELFGPEHAGKNAIIVRALYGLRSAGASWRSHLSQTIVNVLKYKSCKADPDIYLKPKSRNDGSKYYSYIVVYVDDILSVDENPQEAIDRIGSMFKIKEGSVSEPKTYLGSTIRRWTEIGLDGEKFETYAMGSSNYVKEAIRVVEERMKEHGYKYPCPKAKTPFTSASYRPELEDTEELDSSLITLYQNFIGILRWMCELGRIDILLETSLLSQYMVSPRLGHMKQVLNVFSYLKHHDRSWLVFNHQKFDIEWSPIKDEASPQERSILMRRIYPDVEIEEPPGIPEPRGASIQITIFVDANHAGNQKTRRSQTGILVYANMTPILWISKRQNTVESSTFGSEFLALKHACELVKGFIYKLKMLGIEIDGPVRILCDNQSVVINGSFPESVLKKKHCSVAYHLVRESVASGMVEIYWEDGNSNLADLFTKVLSEPVRNNLIKGILS